MDITIDCPCPLKGEEVRHPDGDTVTLRDRLNFQEVTTIQKAMGLVDEDDRQLEIAKQLAVCTELYMLMGISSWTFVDDKGKPLPVSHANIRDLFERADVLDISREAERLYNPRVLLPLVRAASASSPPTPTPSPEAGPSISAMSTPPRPLRPSKRSSTTTSRTAATETTTSSPDGGSSSSQNSASAA